MIFNRESKTDLLVGQLCSSKQGRDKNKLYIIYEIVDEDYVLVVDGNKKTIENPKKKNIKHLQKINDIVENFYEDIKVNKLKNEDIKRIIKLKKEVFVNVK